MARVCDRNLANWSPGQRTDAAAGENGSSSRCASPTQVTARDVVDYIQHLLEVIGPAHVAIGSDSEGRIDTPAELLSPAEVHLLAEETGRCGMPEDVIGAGHVRQHRAPADVREEDGDDCVVGRGRPHRI